MTGRNIAYGAFVAICLAALVWPGYPLFGNRIEPRLFGLPFSLMWNVLWIGASFAALFIYDQTDPRKQ